LGHREDSATMFIDFIFGWTSTGKHIAVVFVFEDDPDLIIVRPKTACPVPEYGD
jgi:hypothetical protein